MNRRQAAWDFLSSTTARLAASYLAIIMVLSVGFSLVFYKTSAHELGRQVPPPSYFGDYGGGPDHPDYHHFFQHRIEEGRHALLVRLILLNLLVLLAGALLSYYLARRNLMPIENAMESQSRFVADASHELRTPLTAILAGNEVALRNPKLTLAKAKDVIRSNTEEITKLKNLTDGLLSLARQDNMALATKPVSLQAIAGEAMNRVLPAAKVKKISVQDNVPDIKVLGDEQSLAQALVILVDNAIKFSPAKSTIYLDGHAKNKQGYIGVRDEGPGISPVDLPRIFDRFYRADESRSKSDADGFGIGLSIAKNIIEQHDGRITVTSVLSQGSHFLVELPLA